MLAGKGLTVIADFFCEIINFDGLVKSRPQQQYVIPAKAGIQYFYHGTNMRTFSLLRNRTSNEVGITSLLIGCRHAAYWRFLRLH